MQVFTIKQYSTAKEIPRLTRHTATLTQFYFDPTGASHRHLHKTNEKKRSRDFPFARRPSLTAPRVPPAWGTGLVPARARVAGSRRSGFGPSPPSHATPQRLRPPRHSRLHTTPSLLRTVPENNSLSRLREQLSPQPDSLLSSQPPSP